MDTAKVIQVGAGSYLAVYTTGTTVSLATSTDLVNWQWTVDLDHLASQPYIAQESDGSFLVADRSARQRHQWLEPRAFHALRQPQLPQGRRADWLAGPPFSSALNGQRFFSSCDEGTPDIHGISANGLTIDFGFHYNSVCSQGLDREAFGRFTITNIDYSAGQASGTWSATEDTVRDNAVSSICDPVTPPPATPASTAAATTSAGMATASASRKPRTSRRPERISATTGPGGSSSTTTPMTRPTRCRWPQT